MDTFRPHVAAKEEMTQFHSKEYVDFLCQVSPHNVGTYEDKALQTFNCGEQTDCPVFDGIGQYCATYAGGSIDGAARLNHGLADVCVNWSGGLHHAKKGEASGFCYINDIVLAILELLKFHPRVLYIDIDIHHGDGVEEAFYTADRVMTLSFHKYGDFFPGTGAMSDVGHGRGKYYSVNVPLEDGIDDDAFLYIFKPIISKIMEIFNPGAVVLQCGADSLTGDRLGCFNVTLKGRVERVVVAHVVCVLFFSSNLSFCNSSFSSSTTHPPTRTGTQDMVLPSNMFNRSIVLFSYWGVVVIQYVTSRDVGPTKPPFY